MDHPDLEPGQEHRNTYLVIFSPTANFAVAFNRGYHYRGTDPKFFAPITIEDIVEVEKGVVNTYGAPAHICERISTLEELGHVFITVWTRYFE